jgi:hypothetical protein
LKTPHTDNLRLLLSPEVWRQAELKTPHTDNLQPQQKKKMLRLKVLGARILGGSATRRFQPLCMPFSSRYLSHSIYYSTNCKSRGQNPAAFLKTLLETTGALPLLDLVSGLKKGDRVEPIIFLVFVFIVVCFLLGICSHWYSKVAKASSNDELSEVRGLSSSLDHYALTQPEFLRRKFITLYIILVIIE